MQTDPFGAYRDMIAFFRGIAQPYDRAAAGSPPKIPVGGYEVLGESQSLSNMGDGWWMTQAYHQYYGVYGILIYDEDEVKAFLCAEESIVLLRHLIEMSMRLISVCNPLFLEAHQMEIGQIRELWWGMQDMAVKNAARAAS